MRAEGGDKVRGKGRREESGERNAAVTAARDESHIRFPPPLGEGQGEGRCFPSPPAPCRWDARLVSLVVGKRRRPGVVNHPLRRPRAGGAKWYITKAAPWWMPLVSVHTPGDWLIVRPVWLFPSPTAEERTMGLSAWAEGDRPMFAAKRGVSKNPQPSPPRKSGTVPQGTVTKTPVGISDSIPSNLLAFTAPVP